eukprot:scaffold1095_cov63-Phaeocystis_antarctica.AAC.7
MVGFHATQYHDAGSLTPRHLYLSAGRGRREAARPQGRQHVCAHAAGSGRRPATHGPLARRAAHSRYGHVEQVNAASRALSTRL